MVSSSGGALRLACAYTGRESELECDALVTVTARLPEDGLVRDLEAAGVATARAVGDERVVGIAADVSTPHGVKTVIDGTMAAFGGIDILVNNVGLARGATLIDTSDEEWQEAFDQTLFPAIRASRLAVPHMKHRGGGAIVIIASVFGREAGGRMTYNAVKAAEISLGKSLAQQLASSNIRVNSVSPGSILFEGGSWWKRQQENPADDRRWRLHGGQRAVVPRVALERRKKRGQSP